jgi:hypothetical protein
VAAGLARDAAQAGQRGPSVKSTLPIGHQVEVGTTS